MKILILNENLPQDAKRIYGDALHIKGASYIFSGETVLSPEALLDDEKPDIVLMSLEWLPYQRLVVAAANKRNIPTLYVMDGVIEWNYIWHNQSFISPQGTALQPLLAKHIAVIGRRPARILASMGLGSKIHVIGLPRLDGVQCQRIIDAEKSPILLICTARTASHNINHQIHVKQALRDIHDVVRELGIACIWRIPSELAEDMGITVSEQSNIQTDMAKVSGVITFPSTVALDAMKLGIPTAIVEYDINPLYVESAWQIRSKAHIYEVIHELLYPPCEKRAYQDFCLNEELESGDATSKLVKLIQDIVAGDVEQAEKNSGAVYGALDYRLVHSQLTTFATSNMATLQYELDAIVKYRAELRQKILILCQKVTYLSQNIMTNFWIKLLLKFPFGRKGGRRMVRDINDIQSNMHKLVDSTNHKE